MYSCEIKSTSTSEQGHSTVVRADIAANAEPCDGQSHVRTLHSGRNNDNVRHQTIQEEVCNVSAVSAHWATLNGRRKIKKLRCLVYVDWIRLTPSHTGRRVAPGIRGPASWRGARQNERAKLQGEPSPLGTGLG